MMIELSIVPISDKASLSAAVAKAVKVVHESGLEYRLTPMGTLIKGEWDEVMRVVKRCHEAVRADFDRVMTRIKIDDVKDRDVSFDDQVRSVEEKVDVEVRK